ncbi:phosphatase PAP2 family protein [Vibrio nigripulchritudo]|uniref:phosphatase PAP2 family protein n=1 Tax=Vibrio nigripulchritudo TaxID=28173 RepID=UPI0003B219E5|nr:phosphatase PAP2 family protein [Vibrio nigripulchritudo]CCN71894.1 putative Phosphatidic acid phosphatase type 2/haloperoxidase [Vibrio nigripulchritudo SFn118]
MRPIQPIARFDLAFSNFCLQHRFNLQVAKISKAVSKSGDGHLYAILGLALWLLEPNFGALFLAVGLIAFAIELPIYWILKNSFKRRRPEELSDLLTAFITPSDRYSLPSGHTTAAFLMATLVGQFYPEFYLFAVCWAALIGLSRILLGVHFITDIVIGAGLGIACAKAAIVAYI